MTCLVHSVGLEWGNIVGTGCLNPGASRDTLITIITVAIKVEITHRSQGEINQICKITTTTKDFVFVLSNNLLATVQTQDFEDVPW